MNNNFKVTAVSKPKDVELQMIASLKGLFGDIWSLIIQELAPVYLQNAQKSMNMIQAGLVDAEATAVAAAAHTLKGSSANLGLNTIASICLQLQEDAHDNNLNHAALTWQQLQAEFAVAQTVLQQYA